MSFCFDEVRQIIYYIPFQTNLLYTIPDKNNKFPENCYGPETARKPVVLRFISIMLSHLFHTFTVLFEY